MASKKTAERIFNLWQAADSKERVKWQSDSQKGYDFYLNDQLSKDEEDALRESGMPTFTINRITPIIETMKYFVTANNPRWKAVGVDGSDADISQVHSDISEYCWNLSNGKSVYGSVILDTLTKGIGYMFIDINKELDRGKGDVTFNRISPFDVFVDPMSRDFLFRDASFVLVKKNLTRSQLKNMFPEYKRKVSKASEHSSVNAYSEADRDDSNAIIPEDISTSIDRYGNKDDIISLHECYEKVKVPFVNMLMKIYPSTKETKQVKEVAMRKLDIFESEQAVNAKESILRIEEALKAGEMIEERAALEIKKIEEMTKRAIEVKRAEIDYATQEELNRTEEVVVSLEEFKILQKQPEFEESLSDYFEYNETRVKVTCTLGSNVTLYEYTMPIREYPIIPIPYMYTGTPYPMSAVIPLIGKQMEINKAHQVMLHNANLASNLRWIYEEGSVPEDEWEQYSSAPGALLKYRQGFNPPTPILPASINNAFYTITQEGKADMEYMGGIPSAMMGFVQDQAETYRGLLANDEFGTRRIKAWMNSILEPALEHVGVVFKEVSQSHYTEDRVFRIVQPNAGGSYDESETRINIPIYNDYGEAIQKWNDYASSRFDVRIVSGAVMPLNRWALLDEYFKWFQAGLIDDVAMLAETDVRGKDAIIERKSLYAEQQQQIESLNEQLKDQVGENETLKRQIVQAGIRMNIDEGSKQVEKDVLETKAQQKLYRELMKEEKKKNDLQNKQ